MKHTWATVGAAPLRGNYLTSDKVRHNCEDDPLYSVFKQIEESNHNACTLLPAKGLNGEMMNFRLRDIKKGSEAKSVTAPYIRERQDVLIKTSTHRFRFLETGGGTLSHDDGFIASDLQNCSQEREQTLKDKVARKAAEEIEQEALKILESMEDANDATQKKKGPIVKQLCVLLQLWY